jgi:hypothetical protein
VARRSRVQMRNTVKYLVGASPQATNDDIDGMLADVHRDMASTYQWSYRKRDTLLTTVAPVSTGTVTLTAGSATVVGSGTAWTSDMVGRQIRVAPELTWFWIAGVADATHLTLGDGNLSAVLWPGTTVSGQTYTIFQDQYLLPANVAIILSQQRDWMLTEASLVEIDGLDPRRMSTSQNPDRWYWGRALIQAQTEQRYVGLWPVPSAAINLRIPYLVEPPELAADGDLPVCPSEVIQLAAGARVAMFVHAKTGDPRWATQALTLQTMLLGTPQMLGVLQQCLMDDAHRFGGPTRIGGSGLSIGADRWNDRDWASV